MGPFLALAGRGCKAPLAQGELGGTPASEPQGKILKCIRDGTIGEFQSDMMGFTAA